MSNTILIIIGILVLVIISVLVYLLIRKSKKTSTSIVSTISADDKTKMTELYNKGLIPAAVAQAYGCIVTPNASGECFDKNKLATGLLKVNNGVLWSKTFSQEFSLRTWIIRLIILGLIVGAIYGWGWYQGTLGKPVLFDLRGKDATIRLNEHFLRIEKDGTARVVDKDGKILKTISVKDVDGLRQALRPYGFQLKPFFTTGGSIGEKKTEIEAGLGVDFFKWYKANLNVFLTNLGAYAGIGYNLTDNFDVMIGAGKGYSGDNRIGIFGKFKF